MFKILKINSILETSERIKFIFITIEMFLIGLFEVLTISSILPILYLFFNSSSIFQGNLSFFNNYLHLFKFDNIFYFLVIFTLIFIIKNILIYFFNVSVVGTMEKVSMRISNTLFKKHLEANYSFHLKKSSKDLFYYNTEIIGGFNETLINLIIITSELITLIFLTLLLVIFTGNSLILTILFLSPIFIFFVLFFKKRSFILGKSYQDLENKRVKIILESFNSIKEIIVFKKINFFLEKFFLLNLNRTFVRIKQRAFSTLPRILIETFFLFSIFLLIYILHSKNYSIKDIFAILALYGITFLRLMPSFSKILNSFQLLTFYSPAVDSLHTELRFAKKDFNNNFSLTSKAKFFKSKNYLISFNKVNFKYPEYNEYILKNLNFKIYRNEFLGIYGDTGAGKTTILNLILKLLNPTSGSIIRNYNNLTFVPQFPYILDGTLKENIAFGYSNKEISEKLIKEVIELSQLKSFVTKLKKGILTNVNEHGSRLSGGQLQRLSIARALYSNGDIIVMDEITNSLDKKTENMVIQNLSRIKNKCTIVLVTHNLNILKDCDRVFKLEKKKLLKI
jgi:ABC-type multidrug transport system fused ATPase/permease subunit